MSAAASVTLEESKLRHHYLAVGDGVKFHFVEYSLPKQQQAPLVVLVHGWPEFWYAWRHQMAPIADAGFRVVAVDLRGFGESTVPDKQKFLPESYTFKNVCDDMCAMLDFFKSPSAIFIGHDWGGAVVWRMARYKPERVAAVASICTPFRPRKGKYVSNEEMAVKFPMFTYQVYFSKQNGEIAAKELEEDVARSMKILLRSTKPKDRIGRFMGPHQPNSFLGGFPKEVSRSDIYSESEMNAYIEAYSKSGFRTNLLWYSTAHLNWKDEEKLPQSVQQNALMVTTGKDAILIPALTQDMEKWIPRLKRAHVEDAGHWVTAEQRDELTAILVDWLKGLKSTGGLASKL